MDSIKNYLFVSVGLTTDETVNTTQRNPLHFVARDLTSGLLDFVENFTKSGVSVRKRQTFSVP